MKRKTTNKSILLGILILIISTSMCFAKSYKYTEEYEITKKYKASEGVIMNLDCQFTDLEILNNSTNNEIQLIVKVELKSNNKSYVDNPWEYITISHSMDGNIFRLKTRYNKKTGTKNNSNFKIKCQLYVPKNYTPDIIGQFSDIEIYAPTNKPLKMKLQHSDAELKTPFTKVTLNSQYSDVEAKRIDYMEATLQYSDLSIDEIKELTGKVQYGDLEIERLTGKMEINSQYSDIEVECAKSAEEFTTTAQYSNIEIKFNGYKPNISGKLKSNYSEIKGSDLEFISVSDKLTNRGTSFNGEIRSKGYNSSVKTFRLDVDAQYSTIVLKQ